MQWSDETVERIANIVGRQIPSAHRTVATQAVLSSLTLADLMQVAEVRELVEAGNNAYSRLVNLDNGLTDIGVALVEALAPFTEGK